jgi:predicted amidohydrolase YtcJ
VVSSVDISLAYLGGLNMISSVLRYPDQKLSREEALRGMTIDGVSFDAQALFCTSLISGESTGAYASFQERELGSFAIGKRFDAVMWDKDLMTVDIDEMLETRVLATLVDGRCVFGHVSGRI